MNEPNYAQIAISGKSLAVFGSRLGFLGPVLQDYTDFEDEGLAIEQARARLTAEGRSVDEKICRPRITSMRVTYAKRKP